MSQEQEPVVPPQSEEQQQDSQQLSQEEAEAAAQRQRDEEEAQRVKAEQEEEARRLQEEQEAEALRLKEEEEAAAAAAAEAQRLREEAEAAAAREIQRQREEALQEKLQARREELARLKAIHTKRDEERARVEESNQRAADENAKVDAARVRRDEQAAVKSSVAAAVASAGDSDAITTALEKVEDTVSSESLQHVWEESCREDDINKADVTTLNLQDMLQRLEKVTAQQEHWVFRANELLMKSEQEKNLAALEVENTIAEINKSFESEKRQLASTRKQLKALETEQQYHIRRGTYIKDLRNEEKDFDAEKERDIHNQTCAEVVEETDRLKVLEEDVRGLERAMNLQRKTAAKQLQEVQDKIDEVKAVAEEMEWERELLSLEQEDLAAVKKELIAVTAAVKQQRK